MISFVSLPIIISMLSILECIVRVSLVSLEDKKLIATVNRIFYSPLVLRSFIMLLKYGLIFTRYSSIDSVLSLLPLLSYSMSLLLKELPILRCS